MSAADEAPSTHPIDTTLSQALAKSLGARARDEVLAALSRVHVPCARVEAPDSQVFLTDPHAQANGLVTKRVHPTGGNMLVAWQYMRFGDTRPSRGLPTPLLGEHADAVLAEAGIDAAAIGKLREAGIIVSKTTD